MYYLIKKINPLKLNIARYHFKFKIIKMIESEHEEDKINIENSNSQFPPKKKRKNQALIAPTNNYEIKNTDKNILKSKDNNEHNSNDDMKKNSISKTEMDDISNTKKEILEDFELNDLEYEQALLLDKRNFFRIYWSLLKREHIIIFTFFFHNDFNLYYVKFARFIFLLATDMAMNVFFFADETMHKLYLSYGKYDFVQQIPQIIYSKLVSNIIEVFLCFLMLTDKQYYQVKVLSKSDKKEIFDIIKRARIKLIIFFVFTFLVFLFYWYLVTAFCAVYVNTQVFIKDSLLTYVWGFFTPFIIYFFPSIFRLISLRCKCGEWKFMYTLSELIPIF